MTERSIYAIELNLDIIKRFREAVRRQERLSIQKCFSGSSGKYRGSPAWDFMCAAMDRIEDIANHLNGLELGRKANNTRSAFDFYEFINNSASLIDSVRMLAEVFGTDLSAFENRSDIFKQPGHNGRGTDKKYFEYIRSLCVVHPVDTSRHRDYISSKAEVCPFVFWNNGIGAATHDGDLWAHVYTGEPGGDFSPALTA